MLTQTQTPTSFVVYCKRKPDSQELEFRPLYIVPACSPQAARSQVLQRHRHEHWIIGVKEYAGSRRRTKRQGRWLA